MLQFTVITEMNCAHEASPSRSAKNGVSQRQGTRHEGSLSVPRYPKGFNTSQDQFFRIYCSTFLSHTCAIDFWCFSTQFFGFQA